MKWDNPELLSAVLLTPLLIGAAFLSQKQGLLRLQKFIGLSLSSLWKDHVAWNIRYAKWGLRAAVLALLLMALARPQIGKSQQAVKSQGFEIIFALDVSESMLAEDIRPSRLEKAKIDLSRLAEQLTGHRIGILAFAGSAVLISPLTNDISAVKMYLESLDAQSVSSQGTNFESALTVAEHAFERGGAGEDVTSGITRVLLMASDGEDHEKGALDKAEALVKKRIRIFSMAYGTERGAPIPARDRMGFLKGYKKDRSGQTVMTSVRGDALKALAEKGRGYFTFATQDSSFVGEVARQLDALEKTEFESEFQVEYDEKFQIPLFLAFVLGCLELLLQDRRRKKIA